MQTIKVRKEKLLIKLKENRKNHRELFLKAQEGYRQLVVEHLEKMLQDARDNKKVQTYVNLVAPVDQTKDYDRAIAMLEMSVDEEINVTQNEFTCYVLDDWQWKEQFVSSNSAYFSKYDSSR